MTKDIREHFFGNDRAARLWDADGLFPRLWDAHQSSKKELEAGHATAQFRSPVGQYLGPTPQPTRIAVEAKANYVAALKRLNEYCREHGLPAVFN